MQSPDEPLDLGRFPSPDEVIANAFAVPARLLNPPSFGGKHEAQARANAALARYEAGLSRFAREVERLADHCAEMALLMTQTGHRVCPIERACVDCGKPLVLLAEQPAPTICSGRWTGRAWNARTPAQMIAGLWAKWRLR